MKLRIFRILCLSAILSLSLPLHSFSQQVEQLEKEIASLDRKLKENSSKTADATRRLELTRAKIKAQKALVDNSTREISAINARINLKDREIHAARVRLDTLEACYGRVVRSAYKNRDPRIWYMYMLSGKDLKENINRFAYLKNLSVTMSSQAQKIREEKEQLEKQKAELVQLRAESRKMLDKRQRELDARKQTEKLEKQIVADLKKNRSAVLKQIEAKRIQANNLKQKASSLVPGKTTLPKSSPHYKLSSAFAAQKGLLPWPADGPVIERFGQHYHPVYRNVKLPFNNGVNIALDKGGKVRCVFEGTVKQIVVMPGYNKCVLVQHGEFFTFYCKLSKIYVKTGEKIESGDPIGLVDTISGSTELHFQLWQGRTPQNPENWLKKR